MSIASTDCEILSLDSGVCDWLLTGEQVPVILMTVRPTDRQSPTVLAIRNPQRLVEDVPKVIERSAVLNGGEFVPERPEDENDE